MFSIREEDIPPPVYTRTSYGGTTVMSGLKEMPRSDSRRLSYDGIKITSGVREITLLIAENWVMAVEPILQVWRKCLYRNSQY
jgi:hypothetical protein